MNFIYLLFLFEIILFLIAFALSGKDIMAPSVMMCTMFIISTIFAMLQIKEWNIHYSFTACILLTTGIGIFIVTETFVRIFLGLSSGRRRRMANAQKAFSPIKVQDWMIYVLIIFDVAVLLWYYREMQHILGGYGKLSSLVGAYRRLTTGTTIQTRSAAESMNGVLDQLVKIVRAAGYISMFVYFNNRLAGVRNFSQNLKLFILIGLAQVPSFLSGARGIILQFVSAALIYYYILWHQKNGWNRNLTWRYIRIGGVCLAIGIPAFYFSTQLIGRTINLDLFGYTAKYFGSSIQLFDLFLRDHSKPVVFGEETLIGIHTFLYRIGIPTYVRNANLEMRTSGNLISNVYTFFRRPYHDFGLFGMYVFTILVSLLFASIYYGKIQKRRKVARVDCWTLVYGYLYYWIILTSIDQYSQTYISLSTLLMVLAIIAGYQIMTRVKLVIKRDEGFSAQQSASGVDCKGARST